MMKKLIQSMGGKIRYKKVMDLLNVYQYKQAHVTNDKDLFFYLGVENGLKDGGNHPHKEVINKLIDTKKEINELLDDEELFKYEIVFKKGYLSGLEKVLHINKELFAADIPLLVIAYAATDDLVNKYNDALIMSNYCKYNSIAKSEKMYFISKEIEEIISVISKVDTEHIEMSLIVINNKKSMVLHTDLIQLSQVSSEDIFLLNDDLYELNVARIINRLERFSFL